MRCKKHLSDFSSTVGVCASCLRIRLISLIEQSESPIQFHSNSNNQNPNCLRFEQQKQNQPKQQPPPQLIFPRSVSPYITRRKSDPIQRFFATPQVNINTNPNPKKKHNKFGLISRLFRSRSTASTSSSNSTLVSHNSAVLACRNKGMSPENEWNADETAESSPARWANRPSPARANRPSPARAASMAFCLSPLVRASPARNWRGEKSGFSGEIRVSACNGNNENSKSSNNNNNKNKSNLPNAASFCGNRSRKLADFGRVNVNR
ncbi:hypothetical protein RND81_03G193100 [Saponaria officinalis]|uniref:Uncharacterized protein n=1 Tax=Saponaria officinalis TaxID=3572 RepID=A0AAW1M1D5_SAPOF